MLPRCAARVARSCRLDTSSNSVKRLSALSHGRFPHPRKSSRRLAPGKGVKFRACVAAEKDPKGCTLREGAGPA